MVNKNRLIIGGIAAGVVQFFLEGIVNTPILGADWQAWAQQMGSAVPHPSIGFSMACWAIQSVMLGIIGVWIYVALRARCGAGPKTAICAGGTLWLASWGSCFLNAMAIGDIPCKITTVNFVAGLPVALLSVLVGAWLYRE